MSAYERLKQELDRTAVISEEFKRHILGETQHIAAEAFQRGIDAERRNNPKAERRQEVSGKREQRRGDFL